LEGFLDGPTGSGDCDQFRKGRAGRGVAQAVGQVGRIGKAAAGHALLVDFIWRRRAASAEVRVSCFQNGVAAVHRSVEEREPDLPNTGPIGGCRLDQHASTGSVGPEWWDLRFHPDPREFSVPPGPLRWSAALDLSLVSRPACAITGRIGIAGSSTD
jgi:hypothetical protein